MEHNRTRPWKASRRRAGGAAAWRLALALAAFGSGGCGREGDRAGDVPVELTAQRASAADTGATNAPPVKPRGFRVDDSHLAPLESLRNSGHFEQFIDATLNAAAEDDSSAPLQSLKSEALLAVGASADAESSALAATTMAHEAGDRALAAQAMRLWATARFRQGESLAVPTAERILAQLPADDSHAQLIRFWSEALGERRVCAPDGAFAGAPVEVPSTKAADGTIWADLNAIEAHANGVLLPMVFVDTGTQHTIMTRHAAKNAHVQPGRGTTQLVGFSGVHAEPAVLETLDLGGLILHDVPILVGDSPPLVSANGQMTLGTELMHHVRFTLDYPARRVLVQHADRPDAAPNNEPAYHVPLWTFSQACLTRAELPHGMVRVLIDTGNRRGTYVAAEWARRHVPAFRRPTSTLVFKFRHQGLTLDTMQLGSLTLRDWPIWDRIPSDLERLDIVDVLVGCDLLRPYRLTIDLRQRMLRLDGGPQSPTPPADTIP